MGLQVIDGGGGTGLIAPLTEVLRTYSAEFPAVVTVSADAVAHTKGAWAELEDSTTADVTLMRVYCGDTNLAATQFQYLVDIGTGAALSETVLIENIQAGNLLAISNASTGYIDYWFPVNIPAGTRIAARCQEAVGGDTMQVGVQLFSGSAPGGGITTMGATTATSNGTQVTAGANAYGSWTEISAASAAQYRFVMPSIQLGEADTSSAKCLLQVGTGAALAETAIGTYEFQTLSTEGIESLTVMPWQARTVPAGTRLSVRILGGVTADIFQVALHGVT